MLFTRFFSFLSFFFCPLPFLSCLFVFFLLHRFCFRFHFNGIFFGLVSARIRHLHRLYQISHGNSNTLHDEMPILYDVNNGIFFFNKKNSPKYLQICWKLAFAHCFFAQWNIPSTFSVHGRFKYFLFVLFLFLFFSRSRDFYSEHVQKFNEFKQRLRFCFSQFTIVSSYQLLLRFLILTRVLLTQKLVSISIWNINRKSKCVVLYFVFFLLFRSISFTPYAYSLRNLSALCSCINKPGSWRSLVSFNLFVENAWSQLKKWIRKFCSPF